MSTVNRSLTELAPEARRALLAKLLKEKAERPKSFPLSFAQERLWFLDRLTPGNVSYNLPASTPLPMVVDEVILERALTELVQRHETLRTTFTARDGRPEQVIATAREYKLAVLDLRSVSDAERVAQLQELVLRDAQQAFDLEQGPLWRATLVKLAESSSYLLLNMHHIISDAWSAGVFYRELWTLYEAYAQGRSSPLAELRIQYADYAVWQREQLQGEVLEAELSYWREQLRGAPGVLELPADRVRPAVQSFRGAYQSFVVEGEVSERLKELAQAEGATLFMVLLAAFKVLLWRYTGVSDLVVGTPIAGRTRAELEGLIGFFVNTLVLRTEVSGDESFRALVRRVREVTLGAYGHQEVPFEKLVEELQPERDLSRSPLFQVLFTLQNVPTQSSSNGAQPAQTVQSVSALGEEQPLSVPQIGTGTAKFDLTTFFQEVDDGLIGSLEYNTDLFDHERITRMIVHFRNVLRGVAANPEAQLWHLPMLTETERRQVVHDWNRTAALVPERCVHELFAEQVQRTPQAVAVEYEGKSVTYAELDERSDRLARVLRSRGVGVEVPVGVMLERGIALVTALLGVWKAGGVYVPLDRAQPLERLRYMVNETKLSVIVTQDEPDWAEQLSIVKPDHEADADDNVETTLSHATPDNLAYMIYTSGSTGRPKGVAVPHVTLTNLVNWQRTSKRLSSSARTLQFAACGFDVSIQEMSTTLCTGGTLYPIDDELRRDAGRLIDFMHQAAIERTFVPPLVLQQIADAASPATSLPSSLRDIIVAGEQLQLTKSMIDLLNRSDCTLHNHYGPTESHVVTSYTFPEEFENWPAFPPIGRPLDNTQIYLLDDWFNPVGVGLPGALYIAGTALARGYYDQPDLTAERFVPNPFSEQSGTRLYRTGDLARYLPDGEIEFLGRTDYQIKLRGFRVELGEIDAVLSQHPDVLGAIAVLDERTGGDKRVVCYVSAREPLKSSDLQAFLRSRLPEYMVPAIFVFMDHFPLTINGKIDRKALPAVGDVRPVSSSEYLQPRTPIEEQLASIWSEVLRVERVGVDDNFFELGGHSLLATQVVARARDAFGQDLPVRSIFETPTIAGLSRSVLFMRAQTEDEKLIADLLAEVEALSDTEVQTMAAKASPATG